MRGVPFVLQDAAQSGNGAVILVPPSFKEHRITIRGAGGVAAGAVQPEAADAPDYSGTWGRIGGGPVTVVDVAELVVSFEGVFNAIRCRISTNIVMGNVTVTYTGHP